MTDNIPVSGQFDDADDINNDINFNRFSNENNNFEAAEVSCDELDETFDDYYDKYDLHESSKTALNVRDFEEKVDLSARSRQTSRGKDKGDNATFDRVLDSRSMKIMYKMMLHNEFTNVNGCISAGKEANVYHAPSCTGEDLVLKVYMTAIMPFKSREKYMRGDNRFKNVSMGSSTKLINAWAEKEFRNLNRLYNTNGAVPCPRPIKQVGMVVLMSMIGDNGIGAPRLKDCNVDNEEEWATMYSQVVAYLRIMYHDCHLVHADLSEYNLLYHNQKVYVIDVGQSVEHEHPNAFNFLRKDCHTINTFFRRQHIVTLSLRELFFFIIEDSKSMDKSIADAGETDLYPTIARRIAASTFAHDGEDDGFFMDCHIERYLGNINGEHIHDQYREIVKNPDYVDTLLFAKVVGIDEGLKTIRATKIQNIKKHKRTLRTKKEMLKKQLEGDETAEEEEGEKGQEGEEGDTADEKAEEGDKTEADAFYRPKNEDNESKKQRKKQVKEAQKETRVRKKQEVLEEKFRTVSGFKYKNMTMN